MKKHIRFIIVTVVLCVSVLLTYRHILVGQNASALPNNEFPNQIGQWTATDVSYDEVIVNVLKPDRIVYKTYSKSKDDQPITLFMAYYRSLEKADLSHSPVVCFTGQGWDIKGMEKKMISVSLPETKQFPVNAMVQTKLNTTVVALFWYQSPRRAFSNRGIQKLYLFGDNLLGQSDHNAFVRITATLLPGQSVKEVTSRLFSFVTEVYPELERFFL